MKKILFVVQRYGEEVNGGSEHYCKQIAEKLSNIYDVSVLTTCAEDYVTWGNKYNEGIEKINNVKIIRKKVVYERNKKIFSFITKKMNEKKYDIRLGEEWQKLQGPYSVDLIEYIKKNKNNYDTIIFMTYLYYTTYCGLQIEPEKSILIPTAHDEPSIYYKIYEKIFRIPKVILYLTESEKFFVKKKFKNEENYSDVIGVGIDLDKNVESINLEKRFNIKNDYILYLGRVDESKGCRQMIDYFIQYKSIYKNNIKLVLAGKKAMEIPKNEDILDLGFISEEEKINLLKECKVLILPSQYESLSLSTLEAMYLSKPVLLNGKCEVLKEHAVLSNGGLYYENKWEFIESLKFLLDNPKISNKMGKNGRKYVDINYNWDRTLKKLKKAIEYVNENYEKV